MINEELQEKLLSVFDKRFQDYNDPFYSFGWENDDIKTVITHEQMEQMTYKVGE